MHELAVTQSLLDMAVKHANEAGAGRIAGLNLTIGDLATIIDDSVQFYWDIITKDTIAEGAVLKFNRVATTLLCLDCGESYKPGTNDLTCPSCKSAQVQIQTGKEFLLESIDIEK
jgi:hydrogenase nickel incorporation protein HypA/HybF